MHEFLLTLRDGRALTGAEYGDADGRPFVVFHGLPGSRFQMHPDEEIARRLRARVIVLERPGYGGSTLASAAPMAVARDVLEAVDQLGLLRPALGGISGGGPYALAFAALHPGRVARIALVSSVSPGFSDVLSRQRLPIAERLALRAIRRRSPILPPATALAAWMMRTWPERHLDHVSSRLNRSDREILARPDVRAMFRRDFAAAFRQGTRGVLANLDVVMSDWGFDPGQVDVPVDIWQGNEDRIVPDACADVLHRALPNACLHRIGDAGHFMVFDLWEAILRRAIGYD